VVNAGGTAKEKKNETKAKNSINRMSSVSSLSISIAFSQTRGFQSRYYPLHRPPSSFLCWFVLSQVLFFVFFPALSFPLGRRVFFNREMRCVHEEELRISVSERERGRMDEGFF